jgi:hypothetical protein
MRVALVALGFSIFAAPAFAGGPTFSKDVLRNDRVAGIDGDADEAALTLGLKPSRYTRVTEAATCAIVARRL